MFTIDVLNQIRAAEIEHVVQYFPSGCRVLEIGAGTGKQALAIRERGFDIEAIEISASNYRSERLFPTMDYDGKNIPFPDASFDLVFSSNVLEHVRDLSYLQREIKRVLRPGGKCIHVLPTHAWRLWTTLSAFPVAVQRMLRLTSQLPARPETQRGVGRRALTILGTVFRILFGPFVPRRHGERGTFLTELWSFHPRYWRRHFQQAGFRIISDQPMGLHYTGNLLFGATISMAQRHQLARYLGSACHVYEVEPGSDPEGLAIRGPGQLSPAAVSGPSRPRGA